jgi:hypothetical protein
MIWLNHHRVFDQVARVDGPLLLLNLNLLLWTALIPFPTAVVAEHLGRRRGGGADRLGAVQRGAALLTSLAFGACSPGSPAMPACWSGRHRGGGRGAAAVHGRVDRVRGRVRPVVGVGAAGLALCGLMALY